MSTDFLVDEADTFLTKNSDLRGILNSGYRRNAAFVIRADAIYSTWAPVAVAMIGRLPATLEDRSVVVRLKRRRQDEVIAPFRFDQTEGLGNSHAWPPGGQVIIWSDSKTPIR